MKSMTIVAGVALAAGIGGWLVLGGQPDKTVTTAAPERKGDALASVTLPETLSENAQIGKRAFESVCADCHGQNAAGRNGMGPPLVHKVYEPSHHSDMSFFMAVENGVRSHHWRFGNMPPQKGVTRGDVAMIVAYVRELQIANGIK